MKTKIQFLFLLLSWILSSCSGDDCLSPETPQPDNGAIELTVSAGDFVTDGAPLTRATESNDGKTITFDRGDRIGLIIVADNGSTLVADNVPYTYGGTNWAFDAGNVEGKTAPYYDNGISNVTYIAYFPYSKEADGIKTLNALKNMFTPKADQRSEADYRASDLMVWTSDATAPQKKLNIALTHAYASISLSSEVKYTLPDGNSTVLSYISVSDVSFTTGSDVCLPFQAEDGSFRCILPTGTSGVVRCFYFLHNKTYGGSHDLGRGTTANTRYVWQETINRAYGFDMAQVGDFYCKNGSGAGYLVPGDIASLPSVQKDACLGIICWVGRDAFDEDPLLKSQHPSCTHGLVVALQNAGDNGMHWSNEAEVITTEWINKDENPYKNIVDLLEQDKRCGYSNTLVLIDYNAKKYSSAVGSSNGKRVLPIDAIQQYADEHPAPTNSSGWYFPSVMELKYVCWGQGNDRGTSGKGNLNTNISKAGGTLLRNGYWSSTEGSNGSNYVRYVSFDYGSVDGSRKYGDFAHGVRPLLAF